MCISSRIFPPFSHHWFCSMAIFSYLLTKIITATVRQKSQHRMLYHGLSFQGEYYDKTDTHQCSFKMLYHGLPSQGEKGCSDYIFKSSIFKGLRKENRNSCLSSRWLVHENFGTHKRENQNHRNSRVTTFLCIHHHQSVSKSALF